MSGYADHSKTLKRNLTRELLEGRSIINRVRDGVLEVRPAQPWYMKLLAKVLPLVVGTVAGAVGGTAAASGEMPDPMTLVGLAGALLYALAELADAVSKDDHWLSIWGKKLKGWLAGLGLAGLGAGAAG